MGKIKMKKSGKSYKTIAIILVFSLVMSWFAPNSLAATMTDLRIGLTKFYKDKATLRIKTTKVGLGYSVNNLYTCEEEFNSLTGFAFQPATGSYYILNQTYQTYAEAMKSVKLIRAFGVESYPVSIYRSTWKVYIENTSTQKDMNQVMITLGLGYGYTSTGPFNDNGHRVKVTGDNLTFLYDGKIHNAYPQFKAIVGNSSKVMVLDLGARQYRGRIEIGRYSNSTLTAINVINVESYLYGVVPSEMVSSWPTQALRAQAVCARSFATSKTAYGTDSDITKGYTLEDSTSSQVYKGYGSETVAANSAVDATRGEVVTYKGNVIPAYYYSTSGGRTEDSADVWGVKAPYLASVVDEFETEPEKEPWVIAMPMSELEQKLEQAGYDVGTVKKVIAEIATVSDRVYSLKVIGSKKSQVIRSQEIREVFDLYSTKFKIISYQDQSNQVAVLSDGNTTSANLNDCFVINGDDKVTELKNTDNRIYIVKSSNNLTQFIKDTPTNPDVIYFVGLGYGHGVGLSQSGAKGLANQGYSYQEIIQYYYKDCYVKVFQ
jgi:stage II sporulation protein D